MMTHELELAPKMFEADMLKKLRNRDEVNFYCRGTEVVPSKNSKKNRLQCTPVTTTREVVQLPK